MRNTITIRCSHCGYLFHNEQSNKSSQEHEQCPICGSPKRNICVNLVAEIGSSVKAEVVKPDVTIEKEATLFTDAKLERQAPGSKHKKNRADYELQQGRRIGKNGKLVYRRSVKDREHPDSDDSYQELVKDAKNGAVIVDKHEKLSGHR